METSENTEIIVAESGVRLGALQLNGPGDVINRASMIADELYQIVEKKKLFSLIQGKKFPRVEAWTTVGGMLGVIPREANPPKLTVYEDGTEEYEAVVELVRVSDGAIVGRASAIVGTDEPTWRNRPRYARRSMAVTRATGKAYRLGFSWIMSLAGYEPTPAEEMDGVIDGHFSERQPVSNGAKKKGNPTPPEPEAPPEIETDAIPQNGKRPYHPDVVKTKIPEIGKLSLERGDALGDRDRNMIAVNLEACFAGDQDATERRKTVMRFLVDKTSVKDLTVSEALGFKKWLNAQPDDGGLWSPDGMAVKEAQAIYTLALKVEGQMDLI